MYRAYHHFHVFRNLIVPQSLSRDTRERVKIFVLVSIIVTARTATEAVSNIAEYTSQSHVRWPELGHSPQIIVCHKMPQKKLWGKNLAETLDI